MNDAVLSRPRSELLRNLGNVLVFILALVGACGGIRATLPFPKVPGIYEKYLHFSRHKAEYDVLFTGSSRIYRAIIPQQFDVQIAAATGEKVRSINLGYDGVQPPESYFLLRKFLALKPPHLRWVFVEATPYQSIVLPGRPTRRLAYWHDVRHTCLILQAIAVEAIPLSEKWQRWSEHSGYAFTQLTNADIGAQWLRPRLGLEKREKPNQWDPPKEWAQSDGYAAYDDREARLNGDLRERFVRKVAVKAPGPVKTVSPSWRRELDRLVAELREAGAQPIFIMTPSVQGLENFQGYPGNVPLFRFQDPAQFPALFDPANHYDHSHLNDSGAKILTDLVSARFADLLKTRQ